MAEPLLTLDDFAGQVGDTVTLEADDGEVPVALVAAHPLPRSPREGGSFRLEFEGPLQPELRQRTYVFQLDRGPTAIFIVPIARTASGMRYEAVFA